METINRKYIVDENNKKIAVQLDIDTFNKIEELLENYGLVKLMNENKNENRLEINEAIEYYNKFPKKK